MSYKVNTEKLGDTFPLPGEVADRLLKLASHTQLKVLLYFFRHLSASPDAQKCAGELGIPVSDAEDALLFWAQEGILSGEAKPLEEPVVRTALKPAEPSRQDVIRRGLEDKKIAFLLNEAQLKFARGLKQNESGYLVYLYDDCGMDTSLILYLLQYAASKGRCNITYIRSVANRWLNKNITSVPQAEADIADSVKRELAWSVVQKTFGLDRRAPSEKEGEAAYRWTAEWEFSPEMLKAAYDVCVDTKGKCNIKYINAVLENWHKNDVKTKEDIEKADKKAEKKNGYAGFSIEKFEEMLNKD